MKLLTAVLLLGGMLGCAKKPKPEVVRHYDLCLDEVCFDRTDGQGHKQEFTPAEMEKVHKMLLCQEGK